MDSGKSRFTRVGTAIVLVGTLLIGGTLVSVAFADTRSLEAAPATSAVTASLRDADARPFLDAVVDAAADALAVSTDELSGQLADGASLKQIADAREVGYGTVARRMNDAVSAALDGAVGGELLSPQRADEIRSAVAAWIDAGGQPDGLLPAG